MNSGGWFMMIASISTVLLLSGFCMFRVLTLPAVEVEEHLKAPPDIDTGDRKDAD